MTLETISTPLVIAFTLLSALCVGVVLGQSFPASKTAECQKTYIECAQRCQEIHESDANPIAGWGVIDFGDTCICGVTLD